MPPMPGMEVTRSEPPAVLLRIPSSAKVRYDVPSAARTSSQYSGYKRAMAALRETSSTAQDDRLAVALPCWRHGTPPMSTKPFRRSKVQEKAAMALEDVSAYGSYRQKPP